jgi:hypothetical protein
MLPILDDPLHDEVCGEVAATVDLTEDASFLGLLEDREGANEGPPDCTETLPAALPQRETSSRQREPPELWGNYSSKGGMLVSQRYRRPRGLAATNTVRASATHLVGIRAIPVRHNFCLAMTHQVHLGREQGSGALPRETTTTDHHPRQAQANES